MIFSRFTQKIKNKLPCLGLGWAKYAGLVFLGWEGAKGIYYIHICPSPEYWNLGRVWDEEYLTYHYCFGPFLRFALLPYADEN